MLIFKPENHLYLSSDGSNIDWISATSLISAFKPPFDGPATAKKCSTNKKSKWYGMTPEEILAAWDAESTRATTLGTWYHNEREKQLCQHDTIQRDGVDLQIFRPIENDGIKYAPDQKLKEGIYPEHMVYLKSSGICGQSDLVEVVNGKVDILDFKTNKEVKTEGFKNWEGISTKMKGPLSHLDDCHINHYALQLSLYMYIMLKHNYTLKPGKLTIHHIQFEIAGEDKYGYPIAALDTNGDPIVKDIIPYDLPYLKTEVISIINWLKDNRHTIQSKSKAA